VLGVFAAWQLLLMKALPGRSYSGPITARGNIPRYTANGLEAFFLTIACYLLLSTWGAGVWLPAAARFSPAILYEEYPRMVSFLSPAALVLCALLCIKGLALPSSSDCGSSGNWVQDFFWGTELYPRVLGWDVKQFTNCRAGMMLWALLPIAFGAHLEEKGACTLDYQVNLALQLVYVAKFFLWEEGYMSSMDIAHDRAGYYLCWGCLVWVPSIYVSHSYFLARTLSRAAEAQLPLPQAPLPLLASALVVGFLSILANFDADRQRQVVRAHWPAVTVWGSAPEVILARYSTDSGEVKQSVLLVSGWWGLARHWHYAPELLAALCWSLPAAAVASSISAAVLPLFYFFFLLVLLLDRAHRDDARCAHKYGKFFAQYKKRVPWLILPGIY